MTVGVLLFLDDACAYQGPIILSEGTSYSKSCEIWEGARIDQESAA